MSWIAAISSGIDWIMILWWYLMKKTQITGLGTFLVVSVLWVISCFEQNSMFRNLNVFRLVFDVEKIQLYHRKGHKIINPWKWLEKMLGDSQGLILTLFCQKNQYFIFLSDEAP